MINLKIIYTVSIQGSEAVLMQSFQNYTTFIKKNYRKGLIHWTYIWWGIHHRWTNENYIKVVKKFNLAKWGETLILKGEAQHLVLHNEPCCCMQKLPIHCFGIKCVVVVRGRTSVRSLKKRKNLKMYIRISFLTPTNIQKN